MLHEFADLTHAEQRHSELTKLNWRPYRIYQTSRGTWAFWTTEPIFYDK